MATYKVIFANGKTTRVQADRVSRYKRTITLENQDGTTKGGRKEWEPTGTVFNLEEVRAIICEDDLVEDSSDKPAANVPL